MKLLAVIPAKSGSRGIPNKNATLIAGKPLIQWTIECALAAPSVDRVLVTTDSPELADLAVRNGADAPFLRPPELARDDTPGIDPVIHVIKWLRKHESLFPEYVVALQPTSPLREPEDIEGVLKLALEKDADAVVSVVTVNQHPLWMKTIDPDGLMRNFMPEKEMPFRRQDLPDLYTLNGAIYLGRAEVVLTAGGWYTERTYGYVMPPEKSIDVDTPWDLNLADLLLRKRNGDGAGADR